jgi:transcription antitermination factor NusG
MSEPANEPGRVAPGQRIRIRAGVFENFEATVDWIDPERGKVYAGINVFGCVTPVELELDDCEPIGR